MTSVEIIFAIKHVLEKDIISKNVVYLILFIFLSRLSGTWYLNIEASKKEKKA